MKKNQYKFLAAVGFVVLLLVIIGLKPERLFIASGADTDAATVYKTKCAVCHTAKAEKFFDLSKSDEQLAEVILKGKKDAKPPMPEFASKGITPEQAKALVAHMRSLRTPGGANTNVNTGNANANANANVNANTGGNTNTNVNPNANAPVNANANAPVNANVVKPVNANAVKPVNANANKPVNASVVKPVNANVKKPVKKKAKPNE